MFYLAGRSLLFEQEKISEFTLNIILSGQIDLIINGWGEGIKC